MGIKQNGHALKPTDMANLTAEQAKEHLAKLEKTKISRREAFAHIGFRAGAILVASLTADDLLRAVGREMERRAGDNQVAQKVAQEFKNAGVAFADPSGCGNCSSDCVPDDETDCVPCGTNCLGLKPKRKPCPQGESGNCQNCASYYARGCNKGQYPDGHYSNPLECCQYECENCCKPKDGGTLSPCGNAPNIVQGKYTLCQQECARIYGQPW